MDSAPLFITSRICIARQRGIRKHSNKNLTSTSRSTSVSIFGGYELGLDPDLRLSKPGPGGGVAYWRVEQIEAAVQHFASVGAIVAAPVQDVGGGIKVATVADPFGNLIGLIENPGVRLPDQ